MALDGIGFNLVGGAMIALWLLLLVANGSYDHRVFGVGPDEFKRVFMAGAQLAGITAIVAYLADIGIARGFLAVAAPIGTLGLLLDRYFARKYLHRLRRNGEWSHRVLIVGDLVRARELLRTLTRDRHAGLNVVGVCLTDGTVGVSDLRHDVPVMGGADDVARVDHPARLRHRGSHHFAPLRPGCAPPSRLVAGGLGRRRDRGARR